MATSAEQEQTQEKDGGVLGGIMRGVPPDDRGVTQSENKEDISSGPSFPRNFLRNFLRIRAETEIQL
ncbi:hypothetical protein RUM43_013950 [Polyplax serrata]|uniref:Uncharacterized protein n=1 Tax=Polyplax serrata TaxID=468196 RepID=A0AAN8P1J4_POLSC